MFYVAFLETDSCEFKKFLFRSASLEECRAFVKRLSPKKAENVFIFNKLDEIVE